MPQTLLTPPTIDQATIDHYVAEGRRVRARAIAEMVRRLFSAPEPAPAKATGCSA